MNKVRSGALLQLQSTHPAAGRRCIRIAGFSPDFQKFLTMLALIAWALFWGLIAAGFAQYVLEPESVNAVGDGLRELKCPESQPLWDCMVFAEVDDAG